MNEDLRQLQDKYARIAVKLAEEYGYPEWRQSLPPVDELVNTILSQNTNDVNRDVAFDRLKVRYPTWEEVRDADPEELIDIVRPAGLANTKGPRIQAALRYLEEVQGEISLKHLENMPVDEAKIWLTNIDGIGPKTAAIILLFAMNKPAFPVDTHVHRVTKRLGLISQKTSREKAHDELELITPEKDYYPFHLQVIQHGRQVCNARSPKCEICVLSDECDYFQTNP